MSAPESEAVIRRWIDAWNAHDVAAAGQLLAPDFVRHDASMPDVAGPAAQQDLLRQIFAAFPDLSLEITQLIAQDDAVAARLLVRGTHRAEFLGIPATDRAVEFQAVDVFRLSGGRLGDQWVLMDSLGMMQQLGAIPAPGAGQG